MISIFLSRAYPLFCYFTLIASFTMIIINRKWNSVGLRILLPAISFIYYSSRSVVFIYINIFMVSSGT